MRFLIGLFILQMENYISDIILKILNERKSKEMEKTQIVIKPAIARKLLHDGFSIIDLKPQKQIDGTYDFTRCAFVFEGKDGLYNAIEKYKSELEKNRHNK